MTHFFHATRVCTMLPVGTRRLDGGGGEGTWGRGGGSGAVGWGHLRIPECMTRCSRSDRSQHRLMKPKHFHRCFCTPGSASAVWRLRPHSLFPAVRSGALSPAPADARPTRRERAWPQRVVTFLHVLAEAAATQRLEKKSLLHLKGAFSLLV